MALKLYMDHHVPRSITLGLRLRDVVVLTAFEDQAHEFSDDELLSRASHHGCVLFSQDDDLLVVAARRLGDFRRSYESGNISALIKRVVLCWR